MLCATYTHITRGETGNIHQRSVDHLLQENSLLWGNIAGMSHFVWTLFLYTMQI